MNLELRHYRYFTALAEELHFGRAAERLGISQPALSQQFRWIEQEAGAPLLSRSKRRIALTEVGAVFYEEAMGVLRQVQHAGLATASASRGDLGSAAIGYVASAALSGLLPRLVYRFRRDHPAVRLAMREMDMPAQLDAVARGELDIGFIRPPLRSLPEGLAMFDIASEAVVVALHATHALARWPAAHAPTWRCCATRPLSVRIPSTAPASTPSRLPSVAMPASSRVWRPCRPRWPPSSAWWRLGLA
ncbi:LysR family transcriptional regulator [Cupriavidus basilensis OR16]|uniref:LysR family transcriptional regulator n=1 Tax=Cupriavidus basilensis OR16 TaxID=1127483 RepID=H1S995_9BURK|nr:LysR family transcriptional regulator [Cupriavidus basilensis OR16]